MPLTAPLKRLLRRLLTPPLTLLAALVFLAERLLIDDIRALTRWVGRLGLVARGEAWVARLSPYPALLCFLLPGLLILPFKLLAVALFARGHLLSGLGVLLAAKGTGTVVVTRIYHAAQPALLRLGWFVRLRGLILRGRAALYGFVTAQDWWHRAAAWVDAARRHWTELRGRGRNFVALRFAAIQRKLFH